MNIDNYLNQNGNRRSSIRWYPAFDFMIRKVDESTKLASGATALNISSHGSALLCYREFNIGDEIYLEAGGEKNVIGTIISS
jgi:hypothetical protein